MAFWSRATQIPGSCRCLVCGSRTIYNGPRRPLRPQTSTSRSSAPAAGIAIDARTRQDEHSWEEAIDSLRQALHRPLERSPEARGHAEDDFESIEHVPLERLPRDLDWTRITKAAGTDLADDQRLAHRMHSRAYDDPEGAWQELQWDSRFPGMQQLQWPANTGHKARPYNLPPQSLWAVDSARTAALRRRHTWKKMVMQELCTGFLIHSLLRRVNVPGWAGREVSSQIEIVTRLDEASRKQARQSIQAKIDRLHIIPVEFDYGEAQQAKLYPDQPAIPRYHQDPDGRFYETAQRLNRGLKELLRHDSRDKKDEDEIAVTVAKICHNLFVSSAPPDVQTFNILIAGFKRWRCPKMVDDIIQACLKSKIRPNEITLRNILGHYISEGRADDFVRFVGWMRGVDDALMLANPKVKINEAGQGRLIRKSEEKVYQKVYPTPMVFGALIGGVMKFGGFERALEVYFEMKADGWGLDLAGLTRLLGDCVRRADWQGGLYIWEEINSIQDVAMPRDMAPAYEFMLSLCSVTGNTSAFNQLLKDVARRGFDRHNILSGALRRTRWAQAKKENLAPAWAADNLLIAVSSFVKDLKESDPSATPDFSIDDLMYGAPVVESDDTLPIDNLSDWDGSASGELSELQVSEQRPIDQTETWASWVEAEFGERPKDPDAHDWLTATAGKAVEAEPDPAVSKEVWETWLQAEFGEKPKDPKS